jgi:PAS domain S-box-containing protein
MTKNRDARGVAEADSAGPGDTRLADYPGAAILLGPDGSVIETNAKGASLEVLLERDEAPEISALIRRTADSGGLAVGTVVLSGSKGEIIQEVTVVPDAVGGGLLVLARDLTMERNLRLALVESRQRYKDLVEVSSDFAWEVGSERLFTFVSLEGALGYDADELVGVRPAEFVIDADDYSPLPFVSDRPLNKVELWMRRKDGSTACMILSCVPLIAGDGEWRGARGVARDVTRDREREAALTRARNREQLLNYIVSTIRDELEPHNMLEAAATATARALVAAGCRIYRRTEEDTFVRAAEFGNIEGLDDLDGLLSGLGEDAQ